MSLNKPLGKTLMIQGTASNVGKSVITAAFCRLLRQKGYRVAPFKAQNMSNNSFVTPEGGEIGRAQAVQAQACGVDPHVLMNPILLKPSTDMQAQVVVKGKPTTKIRSIGHPDYQKKFQPIVHDALDELRSHYDFVVMEGAGSPAEMNLKERDLVNMNLAKYARSPVILVGDIDWGGIFAQLVGTYELLDQDEQSLVKAFLINKFRGDYKILEPGVDWIEKRTSKSVLGVLPFISDMDIAEEDSIVAGDSGGQLTGLRANVVLDAISGKGRDTRELAISKKKLLVDVMWLPRISNFTDFDALKKRDDIFLRYLHEPDRHTLPDLIIIPGTKSTIADLDYLRKSGLADYVLRASKAGVTVLGICGGYQMMGDKILDEKAVESDQKECKGLGLIPMITYYEEEKTTKRVSGNHIKSGAPFEGYEIHMGQSRVGGDYENLFWIKNGESRPEGCRFPKEKDRGEILGTYVHGLFDNQDFLEGFLNELKQSTGLSIPNTSGGNHADPLDRLASTLENHIDMKIFEEILENNE